MIRFAIPFVASLLIASAIAPSQTGSIVSIDAENQQLVVQVDENQHTVDASKVKLLDVEGNPAKLSDFAADEKVVVTMSEGQITSIMKAASHPNLATQDQPAGTVVSTDAERDQIVVKVGDTDYAATASAIKLLNREGAEAKLADFTAGDKVKVTLTEDGVTAIQMAK